MNVFDFDNTIYDGESVIDFFLYYCKKDKSLLKYIPAVANALIKYKKGSITVEEAISKYGKTVTDYYVKSKYAEYALSEEMPQGEKRRMHLNAYPQSSMKRNYLLYGKGRFNILSFGIIVIIIFLAMVLIK